MILILIMSWQQVCLWTKLLLTSANILKEHMLGRQGENLEDVILAGSPILVQYVNDLLLASKTKVA